ncbi:MAG: hypothetical protein JWO88_3805 [Frankiales bacterium]|nr:hypothetical protein [Frankiales bacterium]
MPVRKLLESGMPNLQTYLNDHLAGATGALQLLGHLIDHAQDPEFAAFCGRLREEVQADVEELRELMKRLDVSESAVKKAGAWMAEKASEIKLLLEGEQASGLGRLQALEALCLGIVGKKALWVALQTVEDPSATWVEVDLPRLIGRAEDQFLRTEAVRLETARRALQ